MPEKRQEILEFAYMCSPFYQNLMQEQHLELTRLRKDWDVVPITNRTMIAGAGEMIIPFSYYTEKASGQLMTRVTSGSNGKCLKFLWNREDMLRAEEVVWRYRELWYGIKKGSPYCYFYTFEEGEYMAQEYQSMDGGMGIPKYGLSKLRVESIYKQIHKYQPEWLLIAPSVAKALVSYIRKRGENKIESIRYIELYGEVISEEERKEVEEVFGCTARRRYGCKEVGSIAYECPYGHMHILSENVYIEICRGGHAVLNGMEGNIVVTSIQNHAMPFVRYDTDDIGILQSIKCNCGIEGEVLEILRGQESHWIQIDDECFFHSSDFARVFLKILFSNNVELTQYQVIQRKKDCFDVYFVSKKDEELIKMAFLKETQNSHLESVKFQFHCLNEKLLANRLKLYGSFRCEVKG